MKLEELIQPHLLEMSPYSTARDEFKGEAEIFVDANENPFEGELNRYPEPIPLELRREISNWKKVNERQIFIGNGSDEAIDLIIRLFCIPGKDSILLMSPTYGMYSVSAKINNVGVIDVPLTKSFSINKEGLEAAWSKVKLIFICSPNNPTGNLISLEDIKWVLERFNGLVVVDEAYADFQDKTCLSLLDQFDNLLVTQTFSKSLGLAAARLGTAFSSEEVIAWLNAIKPPYNVNGLSAKAGLKALRNRSKYLNDLKEINVQRDFLIKEITKIDCVVKVFPSVSNFLLVKVENAREVYHYLLNEKVIVRDRSSQLNCENCLRISIGKAEENIRIISLLKAYRKWVVREYCL